MTGLGCPVHRAPTQREDACFPLSNSLGFGRWTQQCFASKCLISNSRLSSIFPPWVCDLRGPVMEFIHKCITRGFHRKTKEVVSPAQCRCQSARKYSENKMEIAYTEKNAVSLLAWVTYSFRLFRDITVIYGGFSQLLYHFM